MTGWAKLHPTDESVAKLLEKIENLQDQGEAMLDVEGEWELNPEDVIVVEDPIMFPTCCIYKIIEDDDMDVPEFLSETGLPDEREILIWDNLNGWSDKKKRQ